MNKRVPKQIVVIEENGCDIIARLNNIQRELLGIRDDVYAIHGSSRQLGMALVPVEREEVQVAC